MRLSQDEKIEIINLVDNSDLSASRTLKELGIHKKTFYNWYKRYLDEGIDGLWLLLPGRQSPPQDTFGTSCRMCVCVFPVPVKSC